MKTLTKLVMGTAVLAASAGAAHAANSPLPSADNSDLIFFVNDITSGNTYSVILNQAVNGAGGYFTTADAKSVTASTTTEGAVQTLTGDPNFTYSFSGDTALSSFLGTQTTQGTADTFSWGILGGGYSGAASSTRKPQGNVLLVGTATATPIGTVGEAQGIGAAPGNLNTDVININAESFDSFNGTTSGIIGTTASAGGTNLNLYTVGLPMSPASVGTTAYTLYGLTSTGSTGGQMLSYSLGSATFDGTTLTFTGNGSAVPLPAAAWLFGSGLLGLLGIGRRRQSATAAAAAA